MATNKISGAKTPYEIRLVLLQMAKEHLDAAYRAQIDFASQMMGVLERTNKANIEELQKLIPVSYTVDEITKKAAEMYVFVLKKD